MRCETHSECNSDTCFIDPENGANNYCYECMLNEDASSVDFGKETTDKCGYGQFCDVNTHACVPKVKNGAHCKSNFDCLSHLCSNPMIGTCMPC